MKQLLMASLLSMGAGMYDAGPYYSKFDKEPKEPKNKFNLTPEQVAQMKDMTPKEKKIFLRELKKAGG